jgi:hypothetical protein
MDSVVLGSLAGDYVAPHSQADEIRHHPAAGEVAASTVIVTAQISKPPHDAAFHGHCGRADRIGADVLVNRRADEIRNDAHGIGRRSDQSHVTGMANIRTVWKQLMFKLFQHAIRGARLLRQILRKQLVHRARFHLGEHAFFFDVVEILSQ